MLRKHWPESRLHQIDALPEVVVEAAKHNPHGRVEQMLASDMATIAGGSKHMIMAMSVFDQNADSALPRIAEELHRVLAKDGLAVYLHNEELNLPATAASMWESSARILLPNDHWHPTNNLEFCSVARNGLVRVLSQLGEERGWIERYLRAIYPQFFGIGVCPSASGKIDVPFLRPDNYPLLMQIRGAVGKMRERGLLELTEHRTTDLLRARIEALLFGGGMWKILRSGVFEIRTNAMWNRLFRKQPAESHFVRGISQLGYASAADPQPVPYYEQALNDHPSRQPTEVTLIAYQYGVVVKKM
jgi:hypothetical protein